MEILRTFLRNHQDWILGFFGVALAAAIAGFFFWGLAVVGQHVNAALSRPPAGEEDLQFNFKGYEELNLGG